MADLSGVLSGFDPTMPLQTEAGLDVSLADPSRYATSAMDPASAMFANLSAGSAQGQAVRIANQIAQQRQAAMPDLAAALAADDPWKYVAANPNMNPIAAAQIVKSSPEVVAQARGYMAHALLEKAQAILPAARGARVASGDIGVPTIPAAGRGPAAPAFAGGDPTKGYPQIQGGGADGTAPAAEPTPDPIGVLPPPGTPARFAHLDNLPNRLKRQAIARARPVQPQAQS